MYTRFLPGLKNSYPFSDLPEQKLCRHYLDQNANLKILKIHFEFAYFSRFLFHLDLKQYVHTLLQFPRKPYPIPDQTGQNLCPFSDRNGTKNMPFGAAQTYMAFLRTSPPPPGVVITIEVNQRHTMKPSTERRKCFSSNFDNQNGEN